MFKNEFVNKYIADQGLDIISFDESRPWGGFYIYEVGGNYDKKILWVKPGQYLSLQFHGDRLHTGHSEEWTALSKARIVLGSTNAVYLGDQDHINEEIKNLKFITLEPEEKIDIPSGFMHALVNPFDSDIYILETRTSFQNESSEEREKNIIRIFDQSQRDGLPKWPDELIAKINA